MPTKSLMALTLELVSGPICYIGFILQSWDQPIRYISMQARWTQVGFQQDLRPIANLISTRQLHLTFKLKTLNPSLSHWAFLLAIAWQQINDPNKWEAQTLRIKEVWTEPSKLETLAISKTPK